MAAKRAQRQTSAYWQWLRAAAVAAGLGAAITTGSAVASADASDSSDAASSADSASSSDSASSATSADTADRRGDDAGARPARERKSARVATESTESESTSAVSARPTPDDTRPPTEAESEPESEQSESDQSEADADDTDRVPEDTTPATNTAAVVVEALPSIVAEPAATELPIPAAPDPTAVESFGLVMREPRDRTRPSAQSTVAAADTTPAPLASTPVDLTDLQTRPDVGLTLNADGTIKVIDGAFADTTVSSAAEAAGQLNALALLLGASTGFATADNITIQRVGLDDPDTGAVAEVFYRLSDNIAGIPVLGSEVILVTDADGRVTGLFNNHNSRVDSTDTTPDARIDDQVEAVALASLTYLTATAAWTNPVEVVAFVLFSKFEPELVGYALDADTAPQLAWRVVVKPTDISQLLGLTAPDPGVTYFIHANGSAAGTVLAATSNAQAATGVADDLLGQSRQINVAQLNLLIFSFNTLQDVARNITTFQTTYLLWLGPAVTPGAIAFQGLFGWNASAVSAHANMATVYDYYSNVLALNSFDGNGAPITISVNYNPSGGLIHYLGFAGYSNAFWDPTAQQFAFGDSAQLEAAVDIVGHEFTHAVVSHVVGTGGSVLDTGESGALNEAYADILGTLIEGKTGADRWLIAEDSQYAGGVLRNLADPTSINTAYGPYRDDYASRYTGTGDDGGEHINSTIFSHAAYRMMTDPATSDISDETWARVFYQSLYRLSPGAKFTDGRAAILSTADVLGFTDTQHNAIERAFDEVGIVNVGTVNVVSAAEIMI